MLPRQLKTGYFVIEGLNSFGTTYYFYYFYFFMQQQFGFGDKANLALAALNGFVYMFAAWWGGRFAQRTGYFTALKLGFALMIGALLVGAQIESATGQIAVMLVAVIGMCFTWPTLEALVSEGETPAGLQRMLGIYNVVWAATGAVAYFIGGALLDKLGLRSMFFVPAAVFGIQLALTLWLERGAKSVPPATTTIQPEPYEPRANPRPIARTKMFLRLAWLANPFAYIAINTLVAVMPGVAQRLELSTTLAGFFCSVWCFARLGAFCGLWFWPGWHYRYRWLVASYLALLGTFVLILTVPSLAVLVLAQLVFGLAIGLIYYSSLFYSMDVGDTKGEHGGIHEAAIGLGNFAGPAVGAASLHFLPQYANSGALAVSALLLCGLGGLLIIRLKTKT
ncbi:MAG: MFS transporter [Verrucomicrobia bacterium]|nr:MFS transporter [Verrucomicrobiota bacterium]